MRKNIIGRIIRIPREFNSDFCQWRWNNHDDTRHVYLTLRRDSFPEKKLQGLRLDVECYRSECSGEVLTFQNKAHIPLSIGAFYRYVVLPRTKAYKEAVSRLSASDVEV